MTTESTVKGTVKRTTKKDPQGVGSRKYSLFFRNRWPLKKGWVIGATVVPGTDTTLPIHKWDLDWTVTKGALTMKVDGESRKGRRITSKGNYCGKGELGAVFKTFYDAYLLYCEFSGTPTSGEMPPKIDPPVSWFEPALALFPEENVKEEVHEGVSTLEGFALIQKLAEESELVGESELVAYQKKKTIEKLGERAHLTMEQITRLVNHNDYGAIVSGITLEELVNAVSLPTPEPPKASKEKEFLSLQVRALELVQVHMQRRRDLEAFEESKKEISSFSIVFNSTPELRSTVEAQLLACVAAGEVPPKELQEKLKTLKRDTWEFTQGGKKISLVGCSFRCTKCNTVKAGSLFGVRQMPDGSVRNQAQCGQCRSAREHNPLTVVPSS